MTAGGKAKGIKQGNTITRTVVGLVGLMISAQGLAQTNTTTGSLSGSKASTGRFKMTTVFEANSNLAERSSNNAAVNGYALLNPSYQLNKNYNLSAGAYITQEAQGATETAVTNTIVRLTHKPYKLLNAKVTPSVAVDLPTSEKDREDNSFLSALSARAALTTKLKGGVDLTYMLGVKKNFHQFSQSETGKFNTEYRMRNYVSVSKEILKDLSATVNFDYLNGLDYNGNLKSNFTWEQELGYQVNKQTLVALGHRNEGAATKADGSTSNIKVFDQNASVIYSYVEIRN